jgi:hypothetical protein
MSELPFAIAGLAAAAILCVSPALAADKPPIPSGPQTVRLEYTGPQS